MLVFFIILSIILALSLMISISTIKVEIDTLKIEKLEKIKINDFKLKIYLVLFDKLKWLQIKISKEKIENMKKANINKFLKRISNLKIVKNLKNTNFIKKGGMISKAIKASKTKVEKLDLNAEIGIENIIFLSYLVAILDIIVGINLAKRAKDMDVEKYKYIITPRQTRKFYLRLSINCIISVKISNIIRNMIKSKKNLKRYKIGYNMG